MRATTAWTGPVNAVLTAAGFPPVTRALRMEADDVAKGATGKVLKREMRDRFAGPDGRQARPRSSTHEHAHRRRGVDHRARAMEVYRQWWLHDAHWYQGVAERFGQEVANEINAEALR